jgi:phosphatidylglycerophosphate synthase
MAFALYAPMAAIVVTRVQAFHPYPSFGAANVVTLVRAGMLAFLAALIAVPDLREVKPALVFAAAASILFLDGIDGWLARRRGTVSRFGARFDMEVDALLIMVLAIFAWLEDKAGAWVLMLGLMRYVFVLAGYAFPKLASDLPPSLRRKAICVVQIVVLTLLALPTLDTPWSSLLALGALALLSWSFLVDTIWLARTKPHS